MRQLCPVITLGTLIELVTLSLVCAHDEDVVLAGGRGGSGRLPAKYESRAGRHCMSELMGEQGTAFGASWTILARVKHDAVADRICTCAHGTCRLRGERIRVHPHLGQIKSRT